MAVGAHEVETVGVTVGLIGRYLLAGDARISDLQLHYLRNTITGRRRRKINTMKSYTPI